MTGRLIIRTQKQELGSDISASKELAALSEKFLAEAVALREVCPDKIAVKTTLGLDEATNSKAVHHTTKSARNGVLHAIRPFVLNREQLYVPKYLKAFSRENRERQAGDAAKFLLDHFLLRHAPFKICIEDRKLDLDQQWQNYANAYEYHRDQKKSWLGPPQQMEELIFWWGVMEKVKTILSAHGLAASLCGRVPSFTLDFGD